MSERDKLSRETTDAINAMLSFYGSQLTSHAGIAIANVIAFLTLIQVRLSLKAPTLPALITLFAIMSLLTMGGLYSVVRLMVYGGLSATILWGFVPEFNTISETAAKEEPLRPRFPSTMVNEYAQHTFNQRFRILHHFYNMRSRYTWIILPISFVISYALLFLVLSD